MPDKPPFLRGSIRSMQLRRPGSSPLGGASQLRDSAGITPASLQLHRPGICAGGLQSTGSRSGELRQLGKREHWVGQGCGVQEVGQLAHAICDPWSWAGVVGVAIHHEGSNGQS